MDQASILAAFRNNWLGDTMRSVPWLFSTFETLHFIGLCILIGSLIVIDLRVLGLVRGVSLRAALKLVPVAILGFAINLFSGLSFFTNNPVGYWTNPAFKLKMVFVMLAGLNAAWFTIVEQRRLLEVGEHRVPTASRVTATLSLALWFVVLFLGRMLPVYQA